MTFIQIICKYLLYNIVHMYDNMDTYHILSSFYDVNDDTTVSLN